jgi:uncharacterized protein (TIGR00251 family)
MLRETSHGVRLDVEVKLRAQKSGVLGVKGERLSVALAAAPVDGAANQELIETLAEHFGVPRRQVRILAGAKSRRKVVELDGLAAEDVRQRLGAPGV